MDKVFPLGMEGLRETPPTCFECPHRKACLEKALATREGIALRSEVLERAPVKGLVERVKRWSEKKQLSRLQEAKGKGRK